MAEEILSEHAASLEALVILPASGGRFVIRAGRESIFNKAQAGRFPKEGEVARALAWLLDPAPGSR